MYGHRVYECVSVFVKYSFHIFARMYFDSSYTYFTFAWDALQLGQTICTTTWSCDGETDGEKHTNRTFNAHLLQSYSHIRPLIAYGGE